ncbi:DNA mismatch repair protein MutT [Spirochaetia bacterium]|nr:DNA mismatch repair protein MutT [Spirochaetia bacterium]
MLFGATMLFAETLYRKDKNLFDFVKGTIIFRHAVRAIILNNDKLLMAHLEKTGEYKFPGGGKKEGETVDEALIREVQEEVGYDVTHVMGKVGEITEYDLAQEGGNNIFKMTSEYYLVEIENVQREQKLENYEKDLLFTPCWIDIRTAYQANYEKINGGMETTRGIKRETLALEKLKGIV